MGWDLLVLLHAHEPTHPQMKSTNQKQKDLGMGWDLLALLRTMQAVLWPWRRCWMKSRGRAGRLHRAGRPARLLAEGPGLGVGSAGGLGGGVVGALPDPGQRGCCCCRWRAPPWGLGAMDF